MCRQTYGSHGQHGRRGGISTFLDDPSYQEGTRPLTREERLMARIEHQVRHDREHVDSYRILAEEIEELGAEEAAGWVRKAAELASQQAEFLARALSALKVH